MRAVSSSEMSDPITSSHPRRRNRQQHCCGAVLVNEMWILTRPEIMLVPVLAKAYCGYQKNVKELQNNTSIMLCHDFTQVTITKFYLSFIRIFLMTYFTHTEDKQKYKTHFSCRFCQHTLYYNVLHNPLSNLQPHSTQRQQIKWFWVKHNGNLSFLAHTDLELWQKRDQSHFGLH